MSDTLSSGRLAAWRRLACQWNMSGEREIEHLGIAAMDKRYTTELVVEAMRIR